MIEYPKPSVKEMICWGGGAIISFILFGLLVFLAPMFESALLFVASIAPMISAILFGVAASSIRRVRRVIEYPKPSAKETICWGGCDYFIHSFFLVRNTSCKNGQPLFFCPALSSDGFISFVWYKGR